jgi:hypothetical protein
MSHPVDPHDQNDVDLLAAEPLDGEDVAILLALADFYTRNDPVPDGLVDRLSFSVALAEMEAELAELQKVDRDLVGARGAQAEEAQTITFASGSLSAMVTISAEGPDSVRIDGWIAPAQAMDVDLRLADSRRRISSDVDGRFVFTDVPHGLVTLVFRGESDGRTGPGPVITPTFQL